VQSITALAHLRAAVLYIVDISEQCGHTIQQQAALFHSIKPLFASKPLLVVLNKIDATPLESLPEGDRAILKDMALEALKSSMAGASSQHSPINTPPPLSDQIFPGPTAWLWLVNKLALEAQHVE